MLQSCISGVRTVSMCFVYRLKPRLIGLKSIYLDSIIHDRWVQFITRLRSDWEEFILYASIYRLLCCSATYASDFIGDRVVERQRGILGHTKRWYWKPRSRPVPTCQLLLPLHICRERSDWPVFASVSQVRTAGLCGRSRESSRPTPLTPLPSSLTGLDRSAIGQVSS